MGISCNFYILVCLDLLLITRSDQKEIMKLALVEEAKAEQDKRNKGICQSCGSELIVNVRKVNKLYLGIYWGKYPNC